MPALAWWELLITELRFREATILIDGVPPPPDPRLLFIRGRALATIGRHADAAAGFARALELKPAWPEARYARAEAFRMLGEWDKARAEYAHAVALAPKDAKAARELAWLLATCPDAKVRDPKEAVALARKALALNRNDALYWTTLGAARYRAGDGQGAVAALMKAVELRRSSDPFDCLFLALAQWRLGQKDSARQWFAHAGQAVKKSNRAEEEFQHLFAEAAALGLADQREAEPALLTNVAFYALVLGTDPGATWAHLWRGQILADQKQWPQATADFALVVQRNPNDPGLWHCLARAKQGAGDLDGYFRVCADLRQQLGMTTDPLVAAHLLLVICTVDQNVPAEDFLRWGNLAAQAHPNWRRFQAYGLYRVGQYEAAIAALEKSLPLLAPRAGDLFIWAMAEYRLGRKDQARATFEKGVNWISEAKRVVAAGGYWGWTEQVEVAQFQREAAKLLGVQVKQD
jgi:tetratricopeptide (TPR) repeat protein